MKKYFILLWLIAFVFTITKAQISTISTVVGNGQIGQIGYNGEPGTMVQCLPVSIAVDDSLNIYWIDGLTNLVQRLNFGTGTVITVGGYFPGNGQVTNGFTGDGQLATTALFSSPQGIALDDTGNIFICDMGNFRVREIHKSTGIINTIAGNGTSGVTGDGGLALSAELGAPYGIAVDSITNAIYITDQGANKVRKITNHGGIDSIYWFAGTGTVGAPVTGHGFDTTNFNSPQGIVVDDSENIYIADRNNNVIQKLNKVSGKVSVVAGNGTAGYSGDGAAATSAMLNFPTGIAVDDSFNLYIADQLNSRVRRVTKSGLNISTWAGTGLAANTGDSGLSVNAALNLPYALCIGSNYLLSICVNQYRIRQTTK